MRKSNIKNNFFNSTTSKLFQFNLVFEIIRGRGSAFLSFRGSAVFALRGASVVAGQGGTPRSKKRKHSARSCNAERSERDPFSGRRPRFSQRHVSLVSAANDLAIATQKARAGAIHALSHTKAACARERGAPKGCAPIGRGLEWGQP